MTAEDRIRWDKIYRDRKGKAFPNPDPLLYEYTPPVRRGQDRRALDLAGGIGQNGLWLATQGYIVDIMDISRIALTRTRVEMAMRNLRNVNLLQVDLDDFSLKEAHYDVLIVFRYLKRSAWDQIRAAVVPGGRIIYESFNLNYLEIVPEFNADFLLHPGELHDIFSLWKILYEEDEEHISRIVAVKPEGTLDEEDAAEDVPDLNW